MSFNVSYSEVSRFFVETDNNDNLVCIIINEDKYYFDYDVNGNSKLCYLELGEDIFELNPDEIHKIKISVNNMISESDSMSLHSSNINTASYGVIYSKWSNNYKKIIDITVEVITKEILYEVDVNKEKKLGFKV